MRASITSTLPMSPLVRLGPIDDLEMALEKVGVAKALWFTPKIDKAFKAGELSYSQVRALTRVADESNEDNLLERALTTTACNLEKYCQRLGRGMRSAASRKPGDNSRNGYCIFKPKKAV